MSITISSLGFQMVLVKMVGEKETLESICVCRYKAKQRGWENGNYDSRWLLWPTQYSAFGVLRPTQMALQIPTQTHLAEAEANERALLSLTWSVSVTSVQISRKVLCLANEYLAMFGDLISSGVESGALSLRKLIPKPSLEEWCKRAP